MMLTLTHRKATLHDLRTIVMLLMEDDLGQTREILGDIPDSRYVDAFHKIDKDPHHYLMVVEMGDEIVGTCHLTLLPSLTFIGSPRLQIEAVHVLKDYRSKGIGTWIIKHAIDYGMSKGAIILQLTSNIIRHDAHRFYERLGFEASHVGMKMYLKEHS